MSSVHIYQVKGLQIFQWSFITLPTSQLRALNKSHPYCCWQSMESQCFIFMAPQMRFIALLKDIGPG